MQGKKAEYNRDDLEVSSTGDNNGCESTSPLRERNAGSMGDCS